MADGVILSKSSSHLDFDTMSMASVCGGLHKTENQKVISVPGVSPMAVLKAQVSGLDL